MTETYPAFVPAWRVFLALAAQAGSEHAAILMMIDVRSAKDAARSIRRTMRAAMPVLPSGQGGWVYGPTSIAPEGRAWVVTSTCTPRTWRAQPVSAQAAWDRCTDFQMMLDAMTSGAELAAKVVALLAPGRLDGPDFLRRTHPGAPRP